MNTNNKIFRIGFWTGLLAFCATVTFGIVQILQILGLLLYPWDEILIYGSSLCIVIPFMLEMLALHYTTSADKKFWSHGALIMTILYVAFVTPNYVVQLATVIPMTLKENADQIGILIQSPHSLFWNFDAIGYLFMGLAAAFTVPLFSMNGPQKNVRISFLAHAMITPLIAFVYFYPDYSEDLLFLGAPWIITAPLSMLSLALTFKSKSRAKSPQTLADIFYRYKKSQTNAQSA